MGLARLARPEPRIWALSGALGLAALALWALVLPAAPLLDGPPLPWWALAGGFALSEVAVVHLELRRHAHTVSLGELPLVAGLLLATPSDLLLGQLVGSAVALVAVRRQPPLKLAFNLAQFSFEAAFAAAVLRALVGSGDVLGARGAVAILATLVLSATLTALLVRAAIAIATGAPLHPRALPPTLAPATTVTLANTSVGVLAVALLVRAPALVPLLALPVVALFLAYRAWAAERAGRRRLAELYGAAQSVTAAADLDEAVLALLAAARSMFRAEVAEIVLAPADDQHALRAARGPGGRVEALQPVPRPTTLPTTASISPAPADTVVAGVTVQESMTTPLHREDAIVGWLTVGNRTGPVGRFDPRDLPLLETFGAAVILGVETERLEQSLAALTQLQAQLEHQAFHDALTGLANRALFVDRVRHALERRTSDGSIAVLFVDLDDFKIVNDSLGHAAGDAVLVAAAERIRDCLRAPDTPARLGGDEFAVLLEDVGDTAFAALVAQRILDALRAPLDVAGHIVSLRASVGIAVDADAHDVDELLRNADVAMYRAKSGGKDAFEIYSSGMHIAALERLQLLGDLRTALDEGQLVPAYQPLVELRTGRVVGVEALVRWRHPERGLVLPGSFIPQAETSGLITDVGAAMVRAVAADLVSWQRGPGVPEGFFVSVNLSPRELDRPGYVPDLRRVLRASAIDASRIVVELTESVLLSEASERGPLAELAALGVGIAVDDFGTGYSSLSYLARLPLSHVKIAAPLVAGVGNDETATTLVRAIVRLADEIGLVAVAEGIERVEQRRALEAMGCTLGQGWLFADALPPAAIATLLRGAARPAES